MKKINVKDYYYLAERKAIKENEIENGATKFNGQWITNYNEKKEIILNSKNTLGIYIPSTIDVDKTNENVKQLVSDVKNQLTKEFNQEPQVIPTQGAWKCENGKIVYENITILNVNTDDNALPYFINLAEKLKKDLTQEGISIGVNNGLLII